MRECFRREERKTQPKFVKKKKKSFGGDDDPNSSGYGKKTQML